MSREDIGIWIYAAKTVAYVDPNEKNRKPWLIYCRQKMDHDCRVVRVFQEKNETLAIDRRSKKRSGRQ